MPKPRYKKPKPHDLYPEPGAWVASRGKGLPEVLPPNGIPDGQLTRDQVRDLVAYEGLGFCVYEYISSGRIRDGKLRKLWIEARRGLANVVEALDEQEEVATQRVKLKTLSVRKGV